MLLRSETESCVELYQSAYLEGGLWTKLNALGNIALEAVVASLKEFLLMVISTTDDVDGLLGTVRLFKD